MKDWLAALETQVKAGGPATLVTIADAKGSSPREAGVKMLVTETDTAGTVGGGNLEHEAIRIARTMLDDHPSTPDLRRFALGPSLGQCCGGDTQLLFEPVAPAGETFLEPLRAFARAETPSVLVTPIDGGATGKTLVTADSVLGAVPPGRPGRGRTRPARQASQRRRTHLRRR